MTIYNRFRRHSTWALRRIAARPVTTQVELHEKRAAAEVLRARENGVRMPRDRDGAALQRYADRRERALRVWRKARR